MFRTLHRAALPAALLVAAACSDRTSPLEPGSRALPAPPIPAAASVGADHRARHQRLARRFALALADADFRAEVLRQVRTSPERESKVYLQRFLGADRARFRQRLAQLSGDPDAAIATDLEAAAPIEIYLPVPAHRRAWQADSQILVATAEADHEAPVAYDTQGRRHELDPDRPPAIPVLALLRAEAPFAATGLSGLVCETCIDDLPGESSGGGSTGPTPGLYMTYAKFNSTFEGWLKGAPEFEVHVLGQDGSSEIMKSYQCAGESAGVPYQYNQDDKTWSGSVMLFSQTQLDAYNAAHPSQALRIFVIEDDDTRCVIKTDSSRVARMLEQLVVGYGLFTGGRDSILSVKTFKNAITLLNIFKSVWSTIQTPDDIAGFAIEDVVAHEYFPGANWIVKADNTATTGAIRLELR